MKKRFFAFFMLLMALTLVTSCENNKNKEKEQLATPKNVVVSEEGLVTWDVVENADEYFVEISEENKKYNTTVYECEYQLENVNNSCTITVVAKGDSYKDSSKSSVVSFEGLIAKQQKVLYSDLVDLTIGEKSAELTAEEAAVYDEAASYLATAAKNLVELGYNEETIATIMSAIENAGEDAKTVAMTLVTILSTYEAEDVKMALYYAEVQLVGKLYTTHFELQGAEGCEDQVAFVDKAIEIITAEDVQLVDHLCNILEVVKSISKDVDLKVMPLVTVLMQEINAGNLSAKTIYKVKNAVVGILKTNLIDVEDVKYFYDLVESIDEEALTLIMQQTAESNPTVQIVVELVLEVLPELPEVNFEEVYAEGQEVYLALLQAVEDVSEEFIAKLLTYESPTEMAIYAIATLLPQYLPDELDIPTETADVVIAVVNKLIAKYLPSDEKALTLEDLIGLTDEEVKSVLVSAINLVNSLGTAVLDATKSPELFDAIMGLKDVTIYESTAYSYCEGTLEDIYSDETIAKILENYVNPEFTHGSEYTEVLSSTVTDTSAYASVGTLMIIDYITNEEETEKIYYYQLKIETITLENLQNLLPVVQLFSGKLDDVTTNLTAFVNALIAVAGKIQLSETIVDAETNAQIQAILGIISQLEPGDLDALLGNVYKLVGMFVVYAEKININEIALGISQSNLESLMAVLPGFASVESVNEMHALVTNAGDVLEKLNLLEAMGFENKEQFVTQVTGIIDSTFPLPEVEE